MSSTTITRGNVHETFFIQPTLSWVAVASYTSAVQTVNIAGLQVSDIVLAVGAVGPQTAGLAMIECDVYNAGVLSVQWLNTTASSATPVTGAYQFQISRSEGPLPTTAV